MPGTRLAFAAVLIVSILSNILQLNNVSTHAQHIFLGGAIAAMMLFLSYGDARKARLSRT